MLAAAAVLAVAVGTASAKRLQLSNQAIRAVWGTLGFIGVGANASISCPVTIEGSFHSRTLSKVSGQLVGYITRATIEPEVFCRKNNVNSVSFLPERLPWHVRYDSFRGTLPNIVTVIMQFKDVAIRLATPLANCLYITVSSSPFNGLFERNTENGNITGLAWDTTSQAILVEGLACPEKLKLEGRGTVTLLATTTAIAILLVQ